MQGRRPSAGVLQTRVHTQVVARDHIGNLPFVDAPLAAVIAAPVTLLPPDAAYRVGVSSSSSRSRSQWLRLAAELS